MTPIYKVLYLVRHGQTTGDIEDRFGGSYDDHLTPHGREQSKEVARALQLIGAESLYASPLIRAQETAAAISEATNITCRTLPDFQERNRYGVLSGLLRSEAARCFPGEVKKINDEKSNVEGSETYSAFKKRVLFTLDKLKHDLTESPSILVAHGGIIRLLLNELFDIQHVKVGDCAYFKLTVLDDIYEISDVQGITFRSASKAYYK
ncbi:histidine phosphatase family protein [Halomonas citrativorans]|uniref:Histidine phosphatase family protein n=1 Tax=Halomonas citrativorans TaxID=2742612 RepID=A0ABR9FFU0_9GAMM|nr:histidine phosphatase family protein [Halomonas citrativorans]MBE0404030.1 histidine phosphatase family protein [Halomonas citrativorans]